MGLEGWHERGETLNRSLKWLAANSFADCDSPVSLRRHSRTVLSLKYRGWSHKVRRHTKERDSSDVRSQRLEVYCLLEELSVHLVAFDFVTGERMKRASGGLQVVIRKFMIPIPVLINSKFTK